MGSPTAAREGEGDLPEEEKRRPTRLGTVTVIFFIALPLLLVIFLFGDKFLSGIDASSLIWQRSEVLQSSSSAFDAASCLSRHAASKLWKPSPFPVSPYLAEKLRRYEANHRRCGPATANYRRAMAQLMSGRNGDRAADCRYVVWLPYEGLGNRMLTVVSTFLYALLTGRVLLVHEPDEMAGLFCEPFPGTSWLLPPEFPYKDGFFAGSNESYVNMLENKVVGDDDAALPPYVYFHLVQFGYRLQDRTFCEDDHRVLDRFNWMLLQSDSYFAVALFLVPMYRAELDRMFPAKASVFHHLGRYLLRPGNRVWGLIERFYDGYLAGADERLGIQMRLFMPYSQTPFEVMYEQLVRCTGEHGLLTRVTDTSQPSLNGSTAKTRTKAVLVVSLKPEFYDRLHGVYYTNATATGEVVTVHQPSHDEDQHTEVRAHNDRALAEIYLLSYCDEVVTTAFSTFGYVAHSLAGMRPWLLMVPDWSNMTAPDVACVRAESVEPCLHSPPPLACSAAAGQEQVDPVARVPFLRRCEDFGTGLKLFD